MPICTRTDDRLTISMYPGWACCRCRTYNPFSRLLCKGKNGKDCGHLACYEASQRERLPYRAKDMAGRNVTLYCDPSPNARPSRKVSNV